MQDSMYIANSASQVGTLLALNLPNELALTGGFFGV